MAILEVNNITKSFDNIEILKDISFDLEKGKTLSIIGRSGSGKTTLLRCLNFLETPDGGTISVNGELLFDGKNPVSSEKELREKRLHFGMVFQQFNLFPQYTALENVILAPGILKPEKDKTELLVEGKAILSKMGLLDRMDNYPHQLSGGQQQRVAIARALALKPDILCFDEPTSALDPELTGEVLKVIKDLAQQETTMIIVTHEIEFAKDVSDEIIFMDEGVIAEKGSPAQIIDNPQNERTKQFLLNYHM
ncbi:amino acid ABC transporter ATP-binding protein [Butyrivibrio sp.]|uniref:amino acid ABC transporter ATP-binding protein n=1 Tax=Butyrivibrio sp. TaxID=28121 RepID=UPI0025C34E59|nr:amino acid ABC transporter ATP-binding protein [Butyrivibrio sp.]MBQ9302651.1 amino acid ABC transporter ATP-binding protein [Butyrivibrio sp.]